MLEQVLIEKTDCRDWHNYELAIHKGDGDVTNSTWLTVFKLNELSQAKSWCRQNNFDYKVIQ